MNQALQLKPGVISGNDLKELYDFANRSNIAFPAVNVIGTNSVNAVLETARDVNSPVIIQFSNGGAHFYAGKGLDNSDQQAAIDGCVTGALHIHHLAEKYGIPVILHTDHAAKKLLPWIEGLIGEGQKFYEQNGKPLFSSHMLDLSEEPLEENLETSCLHFKSMSEMGMIIEIELGVTGGEEDGVDNTDIDSSRLYTQPDEVAYAYERLSRISHHFTIAASFGNVHGVYKPGNVQLTPVILKNSQEYIREKFGTGPNPVNFVFHGGSGSEPEKITEALGYGVLKMNIDTDMQWACSCGVRNYYSEKNEYLQTQIGDPGGDEKTNKKYYEPSVWLREGEKEIITRLKQECKEFNCINVLDQL